MSRAATTIRLPSEPSGFSPYSATCECICASERVIHQQTSQFWIYTCRNTHRLHHHYIRQSHHCCSRELTKKTDNRKHHLGWVAHLRAWTRNDDMLIGMINIWWIWKPHVQNKRMFILVLYYLYAWVMCCACACRRFRLQTSYTPHPTCIYLYILEYYIL